MKTQQELLDYLAETDRQRLALLTEIAALDPNRLREKPDSDSWSILETVEHMVVAEQEILQGLPEPAALNEQKRRFYTSILYPFVLFILKYHIRVPVPSPTMLPKGDTPLEILREEWNHTACWLENYVRTLTPQSFDRPMFLHPVTGGLTASELIIMGRLHFQTHARQIRRRISEDKSTR